MNRSLTPRQVAEILEGSARVDVPPGRLLAAAQRIRSVLVAGDPTAVPTAATERTLPPNPTTRVADLRSGARPRRRHLVLLCAALGVATTFSAAGAGALPQRAQTQVAHMAAAIGINLPTGGAQPVCPDADSCSRPQPEASVTGSPVEPTSDFESGGTATSSVGSPTNGSP